MDGGLLHCPSTRFRRPSDLLVAPNTGREHIHRASELLVLARSAIICSDHVPSARTALWTSWQTTVATKTPLFRAAAAADGWATDTLTPVSAAGMLVLMTSKNRRQLLAVHGRGREVLHADDRVGVRAARLFPSQPRYQRYLLETF